MLERQREGIAKAKVAGKYKGRTGSRGDREASRHRSQFGLPLVGSLVAVSVGQLHALSLVRAA